MRACVVGAGAIGGHLAARLDAGGAEVSVVARGPILAALQADALEVRGGGWQHRSEVRAEADAGLLGPQDVVFVTAKSHSIPALAQQMRPLLAEHTMVVFVCNGIPWWYMQGQTGPIAEEFGDRVDPGGRVAAAVGARGVAGGIIYSSCVVSKPGTVEVLGTTNRLVMGTPDGGIPPGLQGAADMLRASGLEVDLTPNIRKAVWDKLVVNLASGLPSVLTQRAVGRIYSDPASADLVRGISAEAAAIARAMGEDVRSDAEGRIVYGRESPHRVSMLQDLDAGRPMEIEAQCLIPLALAAALGVATPLLETLVPLVRMRAEEAGLYPPK